MKNPNYNEIKVEREVILTADEINLSITKLAARQGVPEHGIVVLFHGNWVNNSFWLSRKGIGLAKHLSDDGFEVWMPEFRGHGQSPKGERYHDFDAIQQIEFDVPSILEQANRASPDRPVHVVGHSYGGVKLFAAMSAGFFKSSRIGKICTLGSQVSFGYSAVKFPPVELFFRLLLPAMKELPSKRLGMGPENEPAGTLLDYMRWKKLGGVWADKEGNSYWTGLKDIKNPCLLISGRGDRSEPPRGCKLIYDALGSTEKTFVELSKENGNKLDYGHTELIISPEAREEVWPMISNWLTTDEASGN